jgi:hypothetical protein
VILVFQVAFDTQDDQLEELVFKRRIDLTSAMKVKR